jgi:hypothetical protein
MRRYKQVMIMIKTFRSLQVLVAAAAVSAFPLAGVASEKKQTAKPYPLDTCIVSEEEFGGDMGEPHVFVHDGREVKLCCKPCLKSFNKETAKYVAAIDAAAKKVKPYRARTCLVSGEPLGSMGEPFVFITNGHEAKLCCKSCLKGFEKNKKNYLKKLQAGAKN